MDIDHFNPLTHTGPLPSPCIDVCQMDAASGLCAGCLRTIDEIAGWGRMDDAAKRAIWTQLPARDPKTA